jgi:hypothetical protein
LIIIEVKMPPAARGKLFAKSFPLDPLQKLFKGYAFEAVRLLKKKEVRAKTAGMPPPRRMLFPLFSEPCRSPQQPKPS